MANKPIFYYSVMTQNRGDMAIRKSIVDAISSRINVPFCFFDLKHEELTEERILKQVNKEASMFIIAGSGLYTNYPSKSSGWYFPCKTDLFEKIKVPIALLGIGCNQNIKGNFCNGELSDEAKNSIQKINKMSVISTVRDKVAYNLLSDLGIKHHQLQLDPATFLKVPMEIKKENRIAINLAQHSKDLGRFDGDRNFRTETINFFGDLINNLKQKGLKTIFIAHDALEQSMIIDLLKIAPDMEWLNTNDIDTMLYEYGRCMFSIGVRMHSNIMSTAANTPFIGLYYDTKTIEYCQLLSYPWKYSIFDNYQKELKDICNEICVTSDYWQNYLHYKKQKEQKLFNTTINKLCDIIETSH